MGTFDWLETSTLGLNGPQCVKKKKKKKKEKKKKNRRLVRKKKNLKKNTVLTDNGARIFFYEQCLLYSYFSFTLIILPLHILS